MLLACTGFSSTAPDPGFNVGGSQPGAARDGVWGRNTEGVSGNSGTPPIGWYSYYNAGNPCTCTVNTSDDDLFAGVAANSTLGASLATPFVAVTGDRILPVKIARTAQASPSSWAMWVNDVQVATFTAPYVNGWAYYEVHVRAGVDGAGLVEFRQDQTVVGTWTGTTASGGSGTQFVVAVRPEGGGSTMYADDFYVADGAGAHANSFLGDIKVQRLYPAAAGDSSDFTSNSGTAVSALSDQTDSTWVEASSALAESLFHAQDMSPSNTIIAARVVLRALKDADAAGPGSINPELKINGTKQVFAAESLTTSSKTFQSPFIYSSLSADAVNGAQVGFRLGDIGG